MASALAVRVSVPAVSALVIVPSLLFAATRLGILCAPEQPPNQHHPARRWDGGMVSSPMPAGDFRTVPRRRTKAKSADAADAKSPSPSGRPSANRGVGQNVVSVSMMRANSPSTNSGGTPSAAKFSRSRRSSAARSTSPVSSSSVAASSR